ncbi:ADP-ribosylation/Crystallin J1 [Aspergillus crustosus]
MATPTVQSRIQGSIFGVAVVDALGGPVEFQPRGSFEPVSSFQHNENFNYKNGHLSATGKCFDIDGTTAKALEIWQRYFDRSPHLLKDNPAAHEGGQAAIDKALNFETNCGNGTLMRASPIGLVYFRDMNEALYNATISSEVTHPYPTYDECCTIYTRLIVLSVNGASKVDLARAIANTTIRDRTIQKRLGGYTSLAAWEVKDEHEIDSTGVVVSTLEAALWAFFTTSTFRQGALRAVNLGWDADTVGAIYGGLAGAFYGFEVIPAEWVGGLQRRDIVEEIASGLVSLSHS